MEETKKGCILVVDDEKAVLEAFSSLMRRFNYASEFYADSPRALEALALNPARYGLVITDMRMPEVDGLTFLKTVRSLRPDLGVIFMTGYVSDDLKDEVLRFGKVVFLEKPFQLETLFKETIPGLLSQKDRP